MESTFTPDDTRRQRLLGFVGTVCVGSTGRLGIVTHIAVEYGQWTACGFGLDGKGVWTAKDPHEIATAEEFFGKLKKRFYGRLSALDGFLPEEINNIVNTIAEKIGNREFVQIHEGVVSQDESSDVRKAIDNFLDQRIGLGDTAEPIDMTPDGLETLRENVVAEVAAGVDQRIGLGVTAEPINDQSPPTNLGDSIDKKFDGR